MEDDTTSGHNDPVVDGGGNANTSQSNADPVEKALAAVESLYTMRDTYFPRDPKEKKTRVQQDSNLALALLDSIPSEMRKQPTRRAVYEYMRGKVLDVFPEYCKEAEDHLSKAVKLDPSLADAWLCLGNCFWKKGDLNGAKNCFGLSLKKGPNKNILRQLSMLERQLAQGTDKEAEIVEESIQHANQIHDHIIHMNMDSRQSEEEEACNVTRPGGAGISLPVSSVEYCQKSACVAHDISADEQDLINRLHNLLGDSRWALIAGRLPWRRREEIENYCKMRYTATTSSSRS